MPGKQSFSVTIVTAASSTTSHTAEDVKKAIEVALTDAGVSGSVVTVTGG
jgi:hypothetical protein